jgi:hypothetical protein
VTCGTACTGKARGDQAGWQAVREPCRDSGSGIGDSRRTCDTPNPEPRTPNPVQFTSSSPDPAPT